MTHTFVGFTIAVTRAPAVSTALRFPSGVWSAAHNLQAFGPWVFAFRRTLSGYSPFLDKFMIMLPWANILELISEERIPCF